ncbi:MAG: hypothetical protein ACRC5M_06870 [Anaeroplasmataceae bacterium]
MNMARACDIMQKFYRSNVYSIRRGDIKLCENIKDEKVLYLVKSFLINSTSIVYESAYNDNILEATYDFNFNPLFGEENKCVVARSGNADVKIKDPTLFNLLNLNNLFFNEDGTASDLQKEFVKAVEIYDISNVTISKIGEYNHCVLISFNAQRYEKEFNDCISYYTVGEMIKRCYKNVLGNISTINIKERIELMSDDVYAKFVAKHVISSALKGQLEQGDIDLGNCGVTTAIPPNESLFPGTIRFKNFDNEFECSPLVERFGSSLSLEHNLTDSYYELLRIYKELGFENVMIDFSRVEGFDLVTIQNKVVGCINELEF